MKVFLERQPLLEALSHQHSLIEKRSTTPILTHVLLEAQKDTLSLTGTDLELSLVEHIPAQVIQEGKTTVSVHTLYDLVRKCSGRDAIDLSKDATTHILEVKSGRAEFALPTLSEDGFPPVHPQDLPHRLTISGPKLKNLIEDTRFAMSSEEARQSLNGVCFHPEGDQWRAVATDAHRLAMGWLPFSPELTKDFPSILVGRKSIQEINKLLENWKEDVELSFSDKQILLRFGQVLFASRLLEGRFPHYWEAIPQDHPYCVTLEVKSFTQSIDRIGMLSSETQNMVVLSFSSNELTVSARSLQLGSGREVLPIHYEGKDLVLGFNPRYLLDICHHIKGAHLKLIIKDDASPSVILDTENACNLYLLMPVRLGTS